MKTVTGTIVMENGQQVAFATLPSGKNWEQYGELTHDLENNYITTAFEDNGEEVQVICEWSK